MGSYEDLLDHGPNVGSASIAAAEERGRQEMLDRFYPRDPEEPNRCGVCLAALPDLLCHSCGRYQHGPDSISAARYNERIRLLEIAESMERQYEDCWTPDGKVPDWQIGVGKALREFIRRAKEGS